MSLAGSKLNHSHIGGDAALIVSEQSGESGKAEHAADVYAAGMVRGVLCRWTDKAVIREKCGGDSVGGL